MMNQPLHHHPNANNNANHNNNFLMSSPISYHQNVPSEHQQQQFVDSTSHHHYHQIQNGLSALLQQREQLLIQQHHYHNSSLNQWQLKEKTIHHILEKLSNQKLRLAKKLKKLKQDVFKLHQIEKTNKMNQQIGGKSKQQMLPPQPAMSSSLSSEQVLATPLSLLLDDPSIGDSQNPITHPEKEVTNIRNNVQISSVNKQRKRPIHSVNLTATSSATTSAAPYSIALDATPSDGHTYSEMPSSIRGVNPSLRKQIHHSIPNSSSTIQATNSSIVFTNNPSY